MKKKKYFVEANTWLGNSYTMGPLGRKEALSTFSSVVRDEIKRKKLWTTKTLTIDLTDKEGNIIKSRKIF